MPLEIQRGGCAEASRMWYFVPETHANEIDYRFLLI